MKLFRKKWHKAAQNPDRTAVVLCRWGKEHGCTFVYNPEQHDDWVQFITENGIERWAYIADL